MGILTEEMKFNNKQRYLGLVAKLGIDMTSFVKYLDSVDYFEKPATTRFFKSYAGGLCEQALAIYDELAQLCNAYCPGKYTEIDAINVALFKDIYKAELYESYVRNVKNEQTDKWEKKIEYRVKEVRPAFGDLGFSSYMIAKYFVDLTDEQIEAICYASLGMENGFKNNDIYEVMKNYKLVLLTHMADLAASYMSED